MIEPLTEPLSSREWCRFFLLGRPKLEALLRNMVGAERCGGKWRLPLSKAPPSYWLSRGLLIPREGRADLDASRWQP